MSSPLVPYKPGYIPPGVAANPVVASRPAPYAALPKYVSPGMTAAQRGMAAIQTRSKLGSTTNKGGTNTKTTPKTTYTSKGGTTGSGGRSAYSTRTIVDPFAKWGGQARFNQLRDGFAKQKDNIFSTANEAGDNASIGINSSILDLLDSLRMGQRTIDNQGIDNEMAFRSGSQDITNMVGKGIRSGATMLANKNATDSSAAGQIERAYNDIGSREMSGVGNQYAMEDRNIKLAQSDLDTQEASGVRKINDSKTQVVNNILADARNSLAALDAAMVDAELPDRISIDVERENVKKNLLAKLAHFDSMLADETAKIKPMEADARRGESAKLMSQGRASENPFDYQKAMPAEFRNTGPFASQLPIFTNRRFDDEG